MLASLTLLKRAGIGFMTLPSRGSGARLAQSNVESQSKQPKYLNKQVRAHTNSSHVTTTTAVDAWRYRRTVVNCRRTTERWNSSCSRRGVLGSSAALSTHKESGSHIVFNRSRLPRKPVARQHNKRPYVTSNGVSIATERYTHTHTCSNPVDRTWSLVLAYYTASFAWFDLLLGECWTHLKRKDVVDIFKFSNGGLLVMCNRTDDRIPGRILIKRRVCPSCFSPIHRVSQWQLRQPGWDTASSAHPRLWRWSAD